MLLCFIERAVEGETFGLRRNTCGQNCVGSAVAPEKYKLSARLWNELRQYKIALFFIGTSYFLLSTCRGGRGIWCQKEQIWTTWFHLRFRVWEMQNRFARIWARKKTIKNNLIFYWYPLFFIERAVVGRRDGALKKTIKNNVIAYWCSYASLSELSGERLLVSEGTHVHKVVSCPPSCLGTTSYPQDSKAN